MLILSLLLKSVVDGMQQNTNSTQLKWVMRGLSVVMVPMTMNIPEGVFVYWSASNLISIAQAYMFKNEKIRALLMIPKIPVLVDERPEIKTEKAATAAAITQPFDWKKIFDEVQRAKGKQ